MKTKHIKKNLIFIIPVLLLLIISVLNMYGASFVSPLYKSHFIKQIMWILISVVFSIAILKMDLKFLYKYSFYFYIFGIALLILVLFFGTNVNGATSWFKIGPISFQPSELFKFFFIIFLAKIISKHKGSNILLFIKIIFITFIPCFLIFLEPDTGVVLMYLLIMFGMILASKIPKKYLFISLIVGVILIGSFIVFYFTQKDLFIDIFGTSFFYRMDRLLSFTNQNSYQLENALIGIGSSGSVGIGLTSEKVYVPELVTDFVFTLSICNFGYLIGFLIVVTYSFMLYFIYKFISKSTKNIEKCILSGIFWMMFFQIWEHIFMNIGLAPITGITLPFLSYGGSSLLSYFMIYTLIIKITTNNSSYN